MPVEDTEITCSPSLGMETQLGGMVREYGAWPGTLAKSGLEASVITLV